MQVLETINLYDTETNIHRVLTVARCKNPKCGCLKAQLIYWDKKKQKFIYQNIKSKDVHKVVEEYKKKPYLSSSAFQKIKQGCRENMNWKYQKDGSVYDLNGTNYGKANEYGKA